LYYVKDDLEKDYSYKLDTELAKRINRHNLYADSIDEQTVYEAASFKYLGSEDKEELKYIQGERRYVHNEKSNILFVVEYKKDAWECIKVIYVDKLGVNSKYRLDEKTILKDFYKESADGNWKCEVQLVSSNDKEADTFSEVTFIKDNSKLAKEGIYQTGNLVYNRTFNASKATMEMNPVSDLSKNNFGDSFITYIEENDEVVFYYNYYEDSKFICDEIGKVEKNILEEIAGYIEEYPGTIKKDIDEYGICIPPTNQYLLPYITNESKNSDYVSDYKEFSYYETRELFGTNSEQLKILTYTDGKIANYDKIYKLNSEEYYENIAVLTTYRQEVMKDNYVAFTYDDNTFKYRVFNNEFVEILQYKGAASNVDIPDYIDGLEVKYIANEAFKGNGNIVEVEIPDTVREIGNFTFKDCKKLQRVVINGNVISYGDGAYEGCKKLETIETDKSPMYIGYNCFKGSAILSKLKKKDGVKYFKNIAISYEGKDDFVEIKEGTRGIADGFVGDKKKYVQEVSIPVSVKYIGDSAFEGTVNLKELELPKNLKYIGEYAFSGCNNLKEIIIPKYVEQINEGVFA
ncbi:MAG: leucine-rich repeat domain-containing protein, partial [Clostridia bacterium]|nr:leucine-rich repeat domain-containing protein [Clostridia bacterium]